MSTSLEKEGIIFDITSSKISSFDGAWIKCTRQKSSALFKNDYHCSARFVSNPSLFLGFIQETQQAQGREEDLVRHNSPLLCSPPTFSSRATQLFVWAHTNTLLFIMLIWHCRSWEGETAVLVWPSAHPSLVPASLHSIPPPPSPPWFHVSLPLCLPHC